MCDILNCSPERQEIFQIDSGIWLINLKLCSFRFARISFNNRHIGCRWESYNLTSNFIQKGPEKIDNKCDCVPPSTFPFVYSLLVCTPKVCVIISLPFPILSHLHIICGLHLSQRSPAGRKLSPDVLRKTEYLCWVSGAWQGWIGSKDWGQPSPCFNHLSRSLSHS